MVKIPSGPPIEPLPNDYPSIPFPKVEVWQKVNELVARVNALTDAVIKQNELLEKIVFAIGHANSWGRE
jgi:hypothetical protein